MGEQERCPECGRRLTDSHKEFSDQWEPSRDEVCYPHVDFGGQQLCAERTAEKFKSELALARKALAAAEEMRDELERWRYHSRADCDTEAVCVAFDAAMAEVRKGEE